MDSGVMGDFSEAIGGERSKGSSLGCHESWRDGGDGDDIAIWGSTVPYIAGQGAVPLQRRRLGRF
jgi:hypothetical protein